MINIGDAIFYGGIVGIALNVSAIAYLGRKHGWAKLGWRHYLGSGFIGGMFCLVPFWFCEISVNIKIMTTVISLGFGALTFFAIDAAQKRVISKSKK